MPCVSVIVATYHSSRTLRCALQSVLRQTFTDFEVWVVGDGCTDDSEQVVAACGDPRFHWCNLDRNYGSQCWPNNEGLRLATGEFVAYLGHDDLWFPWHLADLIATTVTAKAQFAHAANVDLYYDGTRNLRGTVAGDQLRGNDHSPPSGWLHRRDIVETIGDWHDPHDLFLATDADYHRRARRAGLRFAATGELSVIKFPSREWGLVALRDGPPQLPYLQRMAEDPEGLRADLLKEAAFQYAVRVPTWSQSLRATLHPLVDAIGRERWPLRSYYLWKNRRDRKRKRKLRGMPHADGSMTVPKLHSLGDS